jgi:3-oxoacyl-[acyl-carrier protein] reductase
MIHPDLNGKAFLVTGSTRGIGLGIARVLLDAGCIVGIHGRTPGSAQSACERLAAPPGRTVALHGDLEDESVARMLPSAFLAAAGRLDGLVNNAGGGRAVAFRGLKSADWRHTFALNLDAAMLLCQAAYPVLRRTGGGIVNITSLAAHGPGKWMGADYAASKAALVSLTRSLAFEAARFNVRVNAISPGMIETDMTAALTDAMRRDLAIPLGRLGAPVDVGNAAAFLLSEDSSYITGQVLHVDGGLWTGNS